MLVRFHKGITLEGESAFAERKHFWSRPVDVRRKVYLRTGVSGICDESEVDKEIERLIEEERLTSGSWGRDFSGWQRAVPYEEMLGIIKTKGWDQEDFSKGIVTTEPINKWKMEKILEELTGEQFAQFCRENEISLK